MREGSSISVGKLFNSSAHRAVFGVLLGLFLLMDFYPRFGRTDFRYTGCDPAREVLNLGYPLAFFIYDKTIRPPLVIAPLAQVFMPIQILVLGFVIAVPHFSNWLSRHLSQSQATNSSPTK
ncbi:MAG TPA: hypothetical protein VHH73_11885 [Verrucomicrobiae bacterium]|nr:hypothetical protein [Verrucomicrobiae bacterium]